ncbi:MAG TPA: PQQ-binding-like beta-propeller repeat protein [Vicinamibacterales bacterium]|nr:PQQ-binding-like beta-propeller repeat protein [Vicinamibacterales bacterium]
MRRLVGTAAVVVLASTSLGQAQLASTDVTQWRGPNRDGVVQGFTAPQAWPEMLVKRWTVEVGTGYATPLVVGNRVFVFSRLGENETMTALDGGSGTVVWQQSYPAPFAMNPATKAHGPGPKSTPVYFNGRLYSIGMTGVVTAWDAASGKQVWQKPGTGVAMEYTSHSFSPLVDAGRVIFHVGGKDKGALTAFDLTTGDVRWSWAGDGPGYASPIVADLGGTRQIIVPTQAKLVSVDAATGALLWERPLVHQFSSNAITPIVYGQAVIVAGTGPLMEIAVARRGTQWTTEQVWENTDLPLRFTTAVLAGDTLFGMSGRNAGQYYAMDARSGKALWTSDGRQAAHASIARSGDLVLSLESDGELVVLRNSATGFEPLRRYKVSETETWAQPAFSGNRILVKDVMSLTLWTLN